MMPPSNRPSSIKTNSTTTAKKDAASNEQPQTPLSSHTPKSSNNNNSTIFASSKQTSPHFRKKQLKTASNPTLWYTTTDKLFVKASSKQPQTTNTTIPTKAKNQEHALRHKLAKKLSELTEEQDIEEKKFRNAGRKVRDEKAERRRIVLELLKESQARTYMHLAEEDSRRNFYSIDKYEDSQKKLLYTDKFYHGDNNIVKRGPEWGEEGAENNKLLSAVVSEPASPGRVRFNSSESITNMPAKFANTKNSKFNHTTDKITHISSGFGSLVPRLSMARIRDQNRPVRIIREMRKQNSPQVREQAFRVIEAACFSGGHQVVKVYVELGIVEDICTILREENDNIFLVELSCVLTSLICTNVHEAKLLFNETFPLSINTAMNKQSYLKAPHIQSACLDALGALCDECEHQRCVCYQFDCVKTVLKTAYIWRYDNVRVLIKCLNCLEFLIVNHPDNKQQSVGEGEGEGKSGGGGGGGGEGEDATFTSVKLILFAVKEFSNDNNIESNELCCTVVVASLLLLRALISHDGADVRVMVDEFDDEFSILEKSMLNLQRQVDYRTSEKVIAKRTNKIGKKKKNLKEETEIILNPRDRPQSGKTTEMLNKELKRAKKKVNDALVAKAVQKKLDGERYNAGLIHSVLAIDFVKLGGLAVLINSLAFHIESPQIILFFYQTLHALFALHTKPFCATEHGVENYKDIASLSLYILTKYQHIPTVVWSIILNLNSMCEKEVKCVEYIDLWRLKSFKLGQVGGGEGDKKEGDEEGEGGGEGEGGEVEESDEESDEEEGEGAANTGCKILCNALSANSDKIPVQEQFMRLLTNMSLHFNCRMSLLRVGAFDIIEEVKEGVENKGYMSLVNKCQLALETGNTF